jgi:biopolymer transport protein ExbD
MLSKDESYGVSVKVSEATVELKTPGCTVEMKADGSVTVKGQTIKIQGTSISLEADGQLELKAPTISISADGTLTVSSNGPAAIKGMPLALN